MKVTAQFADGAERAWIGIDYVINDVQIAGAKFTLRADCGLHYLWLNPAFVQAAELVAEPAAEASP